MEFARVAKVDKSERHMASMLGVYEYWHRRDNENFHYLYALLERYAALNLMDRLEDRFRILIGSFYAGKITREQVVTATRFVARQLKKRKQAESLSSFKHFLWQESQEIAAVAAPYLATV